ncbi:MAG: hypothetical protein GY799_12370 [Desulfobulbaceae bacterium]|nr:hypothetical protein [Desulfobulbaceae bacterium]
MRTLLTWLLVLALVVFTDAFKFTKRGHISGLSLRYRTYKQVIAPFETIYKNKKSGHNLKRLKAVKQRTGKGGAVKIWHKGHKRRSQNSTFRISGVSKRGEMIPLGIHTIFGFDTLRLHLPQQPEYIRLVNDVTKEAHREKVGK